MISNNNPPICIICKINLVQQDSTTNLFKILLFTVVIDVSPTMMYLS